MPFDADGANGCALSCRLSLVATDEEMTRANRHGSEARLTFMSRASSRCLRAAGATSSVWAIWRRNSSRASSSLSSRLLPSLSEQGFR